MVFGPSNTDIVTAISGQNESNFKTVNNLLSLQENHVEEFFQYHGMKFLTTLEKLIEDTVERVFFKKDYVDSHSSKPLGVINE